MRDWSGKGNPKYRHGGCDSPTYTTWRGMRDRCMNPNHKNFNLYAGKLCPRWLDFMSFLEDMGERPEGTTLDRIDTYGGYTPNNCRWATSRQQSRNSKRNLLLTYKGQTKTLIDWVEELGLNYKVVQQRLARGWTVEEALRPGRFHKSNRQEPRK